MGRSTSACRWSKTPSQCKPWNSEYGITHASLAEALKGPERGWVCVEGTRIVGFIMAEPVSGEISVLAVRQEYEGRGVGARLLELACNWLFSTGHDELFLMTSPEPAFRAYGFYQALGWTPTDEISHDDERFTLTRADFAARRRRN